MSTLGTGIFICDGQGTIRMGVERLVLFRRELEAQALRLFTEKVKWNPHPDGSSDLFA